MPSPVCSISFSSILCFHEPVVLQCFILHTTPKNDGDSCKNVRRKAAAVHFLPEISTQRKEKQSIEKKNL